jgi:hypothetical protein
MTGLCATIPDYQSLMLPVLKLAGDGGEHRMLFYARRANAEGLSCPKRFRHRRLQTCFPTRHFIGGALGDVPCIDKFAGQKRG